MARLHRVIVSVSDLGRSRRFYADLLGLSAQQPMGDAQLLTLPDGLELLLHQRETLPSDLAVAITFAIDDLDGTCAQWSAAGGPIVDPPADQPWGERMAVVRDPDGHLVCLVQQRG